MESMNDLVLLLSSSCSVYYKGVSYSGIQNNLAYLSVHLKFLTLDYKPFDMKVFQLCSENLVQDNNSQSSSSTECPADGAYTYSIPYKLPAAGSGHPVWLASGFQGTGMVQMYAEQDERMLIGECQLRLKTYVTRTEENTFGPLSTPSAAISLGMASALVALIGLCCCYSRCCIRRRKVSTSIQDSATENGALFTRMDDDKPVLVNTATTKSQPTITVEDVPDSPDTENPSTTTDLNSPRTQKTLQMPLM